MIKKRNIKNIGTLLPAIGFVLLLLLSPCTVRNFIQTELGVENTAVSNPFKTTITHSNCSVEEITASTVVTAKSATQHLVAIPLDPINFKFITPGLSDKSAHFPLPRNHSVSLVPLYILYQNFKVYL